MPCMGELIAPSRGLLLWASLSMDTLRAQSLSDLPAEIPIRAVELELKISII